MRRLILALSVLAAASCGGKATSGEATAGAGATTGVETAAAAAAGGRRGGELESTGGAVTDEGGATPGEGGGDDSGADEPEAGDTPHVDRALRIAMEVDGDVVSGRGFQVLGVPVDVTWYWPDDRGPERVYLVYDAVHDHVATLREVLDPGAHAASDRPTDLRLAPTGAPFQVWPSSFSAGQQQRGPGKRASFVGRGYRYELEVLRDLPWLRSGLRFSGE